AMNPERVKLSELAVFKAALSYRRAGDLKNYETTWKKLLPAIKGDGGLKFGDKFVSIDKLEKFLSEIPQPQLANPFDWPYIRGNETHTAQATGSPPLLDMPLFMRQLVLDKSDDGEQEDKGREAETRLKQATSQTEGLPNTPVLPGFFAVASNK